MATSKKKILLLGDDMRLHSGVGTMCKEIVTGTLKHFDWVQLGGAIKHPEAGKGFLDISKDEFIIEQSGVTDGYVKILPVDGYGNPDIVRDVITLEKPDAILHFTDPRFWGWLYSMSHEFRTAGIPLMYYNIWDDLPYPHWNEPFYESCDLLMGISKQTYNINKNVCQRKPRTDWDLTYVQHGVDEKKYFPIEPTDSKYVSIKSKLLGEKDYEFIAFFNSRNIHRKGCNSLIQAFGKFAESIPKDEKDKVALLMHTDVVDQNGTDLLATVENLYPDLNVIFSTAKLDVSDLNVLYNIADVVCQPSSAEGFGLSHMEGMMSGTPTISTVIGGLQDQMGFKVDGKEFTKEHLTSEIPSNSTGKISKEHGEWVYPLWPNLSLQGSPPTPYIYDSRPDINEISEGLKFWYKMDSEERKRRGLLGREWAIENGFTKFGMCNEMSKSIMQFFNKWQKPEKFSLKKINKQKLNYPAGVL